MSTVALSRTPWRTAAVLNAVMGLASLIRRRSAVGRDWRTLQGLPDYMLADIGLERIEFRSAADGRRDVWVIPHRYY